MHGGATGHAKRKARERLEEAADRMARELLKMASDANVSESVRLAAIRDALSRAGVSERSALEVTHELKPFESLFADLEGGTREDYRQSIGDPRVGELLPGIDDNHRPGGPQRELTGVRVLGELPDGSLVIDGELTDAHDAERQAEAFGGNSSPGAERGDRAEAEESRRETLANPYLPTTPVKGYLPAEDAQSIAAETNRAYRHRMTRR